jgi:hypothetical protein
MSVSFAFLYFSLSDGRLRHACVFSLHICFFTLYIFSLFLFFQMGGCGTKVFFRSTSIFSFFQMGGCGTQVFFRSTSVSLHCTFFLSFFSFRWEAAARRCFFAPHLFLYALHLFSLYGRRACGRNLFFRRCDGSLACVGLGRGRISVLTDEEAVTYLCFPLPSTVNKILVNVAVET